MRLLRPARMLLVPAALVAAVLAAAASAADEPTAFGVAQSGSLKVVADVLLDVRGGEMKGVWLNDSLPCSRRRILVVRMDIDLVRPSGTTSRVRRSRSGAVGNCAEGGPNFGFEFRAARAPARLRRRALGAGPLLDDDARHGHGERPPRQREPVPPGHAPLLI